MTKTELFTQKKSLLKTDIKVIQVYMNDVKRSVEEYNEPDILENINKLQDFLQLMRELVEDK